MHIVWNYFKILRTIVIVIAIDMMNITIRRGYSALSILAYSYVGQLRR